LLGGFGQVRKPELPHHVVFERTSAQGRVFERASMVVVGVRRRAFLPVVRIGLEIFPPVELFEIVQLLEFERGVTRFGLDAGRGFFLARAGFPIVIGICAGGGVGVGREWFTVGLGGGFGIGHLGFGSGFGGALIVRLLGRALLLFRLHDRFEFRERKL